MCTIQYLRDNRELCCCAGAHSFFEMFNWDLSFIRDISFRVVGCCGFLYTVPLFHLINGLWDVVIYTRYLVYGILKRNVCFLHALGPDIKLLWRLPRTCKNDTVPLNLDASFMQPVATSDTDRVFSLDKMPWTCAKNTFYLFHHLLLSDNSLLRRRFLRRIEELYLSICRVCERYPVLKFTNSFDFFTKFPPSCSLEIGLSLKGCKRKDQSRSTAAK